MSYEEEVAAHYGRANTEDRLLEIIRSTGGDPQHFSAAELHGADQLHIGGSTATARLAARAGISGASRVLDLGSGLGGSARFLAAEFGATVHGVDLTAEFVATARSLTERTGLSERVAFSQGSVLSLPFDTAGAGAAGFDTALMIHAGMNIQDKDIAFAEAARVLRSGGTMVVYDIMLMGGDVEDYPLPWAATGATSFVQPPLAYSDALTQAGFIVDHEAKPLAEGIAFLEKATSDGGPAGLEGAALSNLLAAFRAGLLAPVEIYAHLP